MVSNKKIDVDSPNLKSLGEVFNENMRCFFNYNKALEMLEDKKRKMESVKSLIKEFHFDEFDKQGCGSLLDKLTKKEVAKIFSLKIEAIK